MEVSLVIISRWAQRFYRDIATVSGTRINRDETADAECSAAPIAR